MIYLLRKFDDVKPTHVLRENFLPVDEIVQMRGYLFVPSDLASKLGPPDDVVRFGHLEFPAWRLEGDMPRDAN